MAFFDDFVQKVNKAAQTVTSKTKDSMEISRLSSAGRGISAELEKLYAQIGRTYVESEGQAVDDLRTLSDHALELASRLDALERQKLQVRNQNRCPNCGSVMTMDMRFCSNCGTKMPEPEPDPEPEPEYAAVPTFDAAADIESAPSLDFQPSEFASDPNDAPVIGAVAPTIDE